MNFHFLHIQHAHHCNHNLSPDHLVQVAVEHGESCGRDLKLAADRVSQSEQEVKMMTILIILRLVKMMDSPENP